MNPNRRRCVSRLSCEKLHFPSNNSESPPNVAGVRSFDCRIEGQGCDLPSHGLYAVHNFRDRRCRSLQLTALLHVQCRQISG